MAKIAGILDRDIPLILTFRQLVIIKNAQLLDPGLSYTLKSKENKEVCHVQA